MARRKRRAPAAATAAKPSITVAVLGTEQRSAGHLGLGLGLAQSHVGGVDRVDHIDHVDHVDRVDRVITNNAELRANASNVLSIIRAARPANTTSAYGPKQEEFQQFCRRKQYHDGETVTEDKLLLFLVEEVAARPLRSRNRKAVEDIPLKKTRLAWRSVRSYVTAITDLYRAQKTLGINNHPSPREDNAREYIKSLQRRDVQQQKANYADKGRDTLLDGYSEVELRRIATKLWGHSVQSPACHYRRLVDFLLGHYMLTRGGDCRALEISDLFTFEFVGEGLPGVCR